jgi:hypothetical protein
MDFDNYRLVLGIHSTLRWLVIVAGLLATVAAWAGRVSRGSWSDTTTMAGRAFAVGLDLQFVVGLVLYAVLSPAVSLALRNAAGAMQDPVRQFWMIEHPVAMVLALVLAHMGALKAGRAVRDGSSNPSAWLFTVALLLVLAALPWPSLAYGRPLMPTF